MFGFSRKNDEIQSLNQKVGRFLNAYVKTDITAEVKRTESRMRLAVPCLLFLLDEIHEPKRYAVGVTSDISLHGLAMFVPDPLELADYVLVFGKREERNYVIAKCKRCEKSDFGNYGIAFSFTRVLRPKEVTIVAESVQNLELRMAEPVPMPIPAHVTQSSLGHFAI